MVKMIPPFLVVDSIDDTTSTTTPPSVQVGMLFHNNNIAYCVLSLSDDNIYCNCEIVEENNSDQIWMEMNTIKSYIEKQNKK